jgi:hypothetical protein
MEAKAKAYTLCPKMQETALDSSEQSSRTDSPGLFEDIVAQLEVLHLDLEDYSNQEIRPDVYLFAETKRRDMLTLEYSASFP